MSIFKNIRNGLSSRGNKTNILTPIDKAKAKYVVNQTVDLQSRNSPDVPSALAQDIARLCETTPEIERCHVLDVRDPNNPDQGIRTFIVVALDDNESQLESVAFKLQEMLKRHEPYAQNCFIAGADAFPDIFEQPEYALYKRL